MPLHISEITVQMAVADDSGPAPAAPDDPDAPPPPAGLSPAQQDEIVAACVRRVLQALQMREGR